MLLRTDPYVALPFGSDRVRAELVGLLLHPVPRSETWRRLVTPVNTPESISKHCHSKPLAQGRIAERHCFGGRAPIAQGGPIGGNQIPQTLYPNRSKIQRENECDSGCN